MVHLKQTCQNQLKFIHMEEQYVPTEEKQTGVIWFFQLAQVFKALNLCIYIYTKKMLRVFFYV